MSQNIPSFRRLHDPNRLEALDFPAGFRDTSNPGNQPGVLSRVSYVHTLPTQKRPEFSLEAHIPPPPDVDPERTRKRLRLALAVLLVALVAVVLKNWDFWFPPAVEPEYAGTTAE